MVTNPIELKEGCIRTLKYYGIFKYPLTLREIHWFNPVQAALAETEIALNELVKEAAIFQAGKFYLPEDNNEWVLERIKGNDRALSLLERSGKYVSTIAGFPFVRGIAISGSLSKYYASENPDIDYFIITAADRLWIARSLLHLFKKATFLTGSQHFYCMNYFIDTKALQITHPNSYSAIETATLLPVYNVEVMKQFFIENEWFRGFLPNHPGMTDFNYIVAGRRQRLKNFLERLINCCFPAKMNHALMKLTNWKWRRKWKRHGYSEKDYERAFMTTRHVSKNHPVDYEKKVLEALSENIHGPARI